eukprot:scaffold29761_cov162-Skeletonema_dohrnii-CCMP3373.AAC.1
MQCLVKSTNPLSSWQHSTNLVECLRLRARFLRYASPSKERRAIPFYLTPGVHAIHFFRGRRPLTKVMPPPSPLSVQ